MVDLDQDLGTGTHVVIMECVKRVRDASASRVLVRCESVFAQSLFHGDEDRLDVPVLDAIGRIAEVKDSCKMAVGPGRPEIPNAWRRSLLVTRRLV